MKSIKIVAASIAALTLAGCANDEYIGNGESPQQSKNTEISFAMKTPNMTRAGEEIIGSAAATKLNTHFVVYGTKHNTTAENGTAANDQIVFNQYQVEWADNTAGTTESNTHNWEYVGKKAYAKNNDAEVTQTIKYWDYGATNGYTFYAFSSKDISYPAANTDKVSVTKVTADPASENQSVYKKGYTVTVKAGASLDDIYYSDRTPVAKAAYGNPVVLTFRNISAKIRVGFYETIPGYSVTIDKFYYDDNASAAVTTYKAMNKDDADNFQAAVQNVSAPTGENTNSLTVTYHDVASGIENRPTVTNTTVNYNYNLKLGSNIKGKTLGITSTAPTWDKENGAYTSIYAFEGNANPMLIRCDYTLTSTDGSGEVIKVKNARAVVPTQYVKWKSNYAYTYLFKISDKTNGTTGTTPTDPDDPTKPENPEDPDSPKPDPEGLFPITFDAVVVATVDGNQETITTVASNSVTSYQEGKVVTANDEYKNGDIYVVNSNITAANHPVIAPTEIGDAAKNAQIYEITQATTSDEISEATVLANLNGAQNGLKLTALTGDGTAATLVKEVPAPNNEKFDFGEKGAVKFTAAAGKTYAYVYCTKKYVATVYEAVANDATFSSDITYYFKTTNDVYSAASGLSADNFDTYKNNLFVVKTAGTTGVYDVKVIKVAN
ncbi:MAG: hypothetical protein KBT33_04040 [Prevotellaceae bacterium]|nr:hypothetical protein [Candidatus Minthosoma equi]